MSKTVQTISVFIVLIGVFTVLSCNGQLSNSIQQQENKEILKSHLTFTAPWSQDGFQDTHAQLWNTDDSLYFAFQAVDTSLVSLSQQNFHQGIGHSDRVELFFSTDTLLTHYYGMEITYDNRILSFHGRPQGEIDYHWSWPSTVLETDCTITSVGYACHGKISIKYLDSLDLIDHSKLTMGVFRGDYHQKGNPHLVTWITHHNPNTLTPNFHIGSAFFFYSL